VVLLLAGCANVRGPQFCNWGRRDVVAESRLYEFHDPLPNELAGPDTKTRPPAYINPRTDDRQLYDLRLLSAMSARPVGNAARLRPLSTRNLVSPIAPAVPMQPPVPPGVVAQPVAPF
jgi:hypothetical protein